MTRAIVLGLGLVMGFAGFTAQAAPARAPQVAHTRKGPTGYTVTFRYAAPAAKKLMIKGEWWFERPSELTQIAGTPDHPYVEAPHYYLPQDWQPGDIPLHKFDLKNPHELGGNWPVADMTKGKDGVWTYTTPLPSGVFTYSFSVDCAETDPLKCKWDSDPNNRPWNETKDGVVDGTRQINSQVYVPSDPKFGTVDYSWQGPAKHHGKQVHLTYPSPGHAGPKDESYIGVYTPPDYDAARAKPYPTVYISQGLGAGGEMNWSTQAVVANIVDNLINAHEIEPMVVVFAPPEAGFSDWPSREKDVIENVIPFVEKHYHVSTSAMDRAYTGGGGATSYFIYNHPETFQYFGLVAAGLPPGMGPVTPALAAALKGKSIMIAGGWQDITFAGMAPIYTGVTKAVTAFTQAGVPLQTDFMNGGHDYAMYRIILRDFLTHVAFKPLHYAPD